MKIEDAQAVYHVMTKVVGAAFLLGDQEKEILRKQLWKVAKFCGVEVLTYCLMSNHFHVLVKTPHPDDVKELNDKELIDRVRAIYPVDKVEFFQEMLESEDEELSSRYRANLKSRMGDVSLFMKELKQRFSIWYNRNHKRSGTLWAERFKSVLVQDDPFALSTVAAYIDLNAVRSGMVSDPAKYRFCCYGEAMGGSSRARKAIRSVFGEGVAWSKSVAKYRIILFGKGELYDAAKPHSQVDSDKAKEVMNNGGKVSREEALRCRVRYFSDGAVLGSKSFVQSYFESHRDVFGARRRDGPRSMKGCDWGDLSCIRNLRNEVFG